MADLKVKIGADVSGFTKGVRGALLQVEGLKLGLRAAAGAFKQFSGFLASAVVDAGDIQEEMNLLNLAFGQGAKEVVNFSNQLAQATNRSATELQGLTAQFGAMLGPITGSRKVAQDMSQTLTQLAVDLGSAFNVSDVEAVNRLKAAFAGSRETLQKFGIIATDANLNAFALSQGIAKTTAQMNQAEKSALLYNFILSQTTAIQGDAANTADSFANRMKGAQATISQLKEIIGAALLPAINAILGPLNEVGKSFVANKQETIAFIQNGLFALFDAIKNVLIPVLGVLSKGVLNLTVPWKLLKVAVFDVLAGILGGLASFSQSIAGVGKTIANFLGIEVPPDNFADQLTAKVLKFQAASIEASISVQKDLANIASKNEGLQGGIDKVTAVVAGMKNEFARTKDSVFALSEEAPPALAVVADAVETVKSAASDSAQAIQSNVPAIQEVGIEAGSASEKIANMFASAIRQADSFSDVLKSLAGDLADIAGATIGGAIGGAPGAILGEAAGSLLGKIFNFHDGGQFESRSAPRLPGMSSSEGLAVLKDGETVLTPEQMMTYGGGGGDTVNITINSSIPPNRTELDRFMRDVVMASLMRGGGTGNSFGMFGVPVVGGSGRFS